MSGSEKLVGKLHEALAAFRKERDDLYRSKELAHERLRLIVEERQAVEKAVNAMQIKLNELNGKIQGSDDTKDLSTLQTEVARLDREVRMIKIALASRRTKSIMQQFQLDDCTNSSKHRRRDFSMQNW